MSSLVKDPLLSVVAPCLNEEGNVETFTSRVLLSFEANGIDGELILINDGSSDDTGQLIDSLAQAYPRVRAKHHSKNEGLAAGWRSGVEMARGRYVCIIDSDLQYQPEDIPLLFHSLLEDPAAVIQGYRDTIGRTAGFRYIMSRSLNRILNSLFGMNLKDNKSGFFVARKEAVLRILTYRLHYSYFQILVMVSAAAHGYLIHEREVAFRSRPAGQSFIPQLPAAIVMKCLCDLLKGFIEFRVIRFLSTVLQERKERRCE